MEMTKQTHPTPLKMFIFFFFFKTYPEMLILQHFSRYNIKFSFKLDGKPARTSEFYFGTINASHRRTR